MATKDRQAKLWVFEKMTWMKWMQIKTKLSFQSRHFWRSWRYRKYFNYHPTACLLTASRLPVDCLSTACRVPVECLSTACQLPVDCLPTASWLPDDCLTTIKTPVWSLVELRQNNYKRQRQNYDIFEGHDDTENISITNQLSMSDKLRLRLLNHMQYKTLYKVDKT